MKWPNGTAVGENTATPGTLAILFQICFPEPLGWGRVKVPLRLFFGCLMFFSSVSDGPEAEFSVCFTYLCFFSLKGDESLSSAKHLCNPPKSDHAYREMES